MNSAILDFQKFAESRGINIDCDGIFGPETAKAYKRLVEGDEFEDSSLACSLREAVRDRVPPKKAVESFYGHIEYRDLTPPPKKNKGRCVLLNPREWKDRLFDYEIAPGVKRTFHYKAAGALICAMCDVRMTNNDFKPEGQWHPKSIGTYPGFPRHNMWDPEKPLSRHSYGCAVDFDPEQNKCGTPGSIPLWVVGIFESWGFTWGGRWKKPNDPMHFEWTRQK